MSELWCVNVVGPDDIYAAPSEEEAKRAVAYMTEFWKSRYPEEYSWGMIGFQAIPWPASAESHARDVGKFYQEIGLSPPCADQTANHGNGE